MVRPVQHTEQEVVEAVTRLHSARGALPSGTPLAMCHVCMQRDEQQAAPASARRARADVSGRQKPSKCY
jgi:hypothetical protein